MNESTQVEVAYIEKSKRDFSTFYRGLRVPSALGVQIFEEVLADFQRKTFEDLKPTLTALMEGEVPAKRRFWIERTKKASKDTDISIACIWLLAFLDRPFEIRVCASNRSQAGILKDRIDTLLFYNTWLNEFIEPFQGGYRSKKLPRTVQLIVEATDASGGAHGGLPDLLVLNELVHVAKWKAMQDHMANAQGNPRGAALCVTNAGIKGTPAEVWRKEAQNNPDRWSCHIYSQPSPWANQEDIDEARRQDPIGSEFARLWRGLWVSGSGDALSEEDIDLIFRLPGPILERNSEWVYLGGLDLGVSKDHAGGVILGISEREQKIRTCLVQGWEPTLPNKEKPCKGCNGKGRTATGICKPCRGTGFSLEVDAEAVERWFEEAHQCYHLFSVGYDPAAGGSFMAQRLRKKGIRMVEMSFSSPKNCTDMATALVGSVKDQKLECYEDADGRLRRDFGKFSIEHKPPSTYKLTAVSDEWGHADVGTALVIPLVRAVEMVGGFRGLLPSDDIGGGDDAPLTKEEVEGLPDALRDIYDAYEAEEEENRMRRRDPAEDLVNEFEGY